MRSWTTQARRCKGAVSLTLRDIIGRLQASGTDVQNVVSVKVVSAATQSQRAFLSETK